MRERPWLCPEPRCTPLLNLRDGDYKDITKPEPGQSFFCWGRMAEPVSFSYDGVEHTNDLNSCAYTPLKGVIRWQENDADWNVLASYYRMAGDLVQEARRREDDHRPTLVMEDEHGDLVQCSCGWQAFDFAQGKEAFAEHLAAAYSGATRSSSEAGT